MKRLQIYAGPNGTGKSSLYAQLKGQYNHGCFVNADELLLDCEKASLLDFTKFGLEISPVEWNEFSKTHGLKKLAVKLQSTRVVANYLVFDNGVGSYEMAVVADFVRRKLLDTGDTFSCETVFSHTSKLDLMRKANKRGYRCYLYFTSLGKPETSIERVQQRVAVGGHGVPKKKIIERYKRTMNNLLPAMRLAYRSFIFDNSGRDMNLVMEVTPKKDIVFKSNRIPVWVDEYVLSKMR